MTLLNDNVTQQVREVFQQLKEPVHILFFGQKTGCDYCDETRQLVEEVAALSDKLSVEMYDLQDDAETAAQYHVDKAPGLVIAAKEDGQIQDFGIRYAGIPSGHEFTSLIQDVLLVSSRDSSLSPQTRDYLKSLKEPVYLQVFVTPT